jgi:hypothetical protein
MAWWWRGVSASQEERARRDFTVTMVLSKLSSIFLRNASYAKHAGNFLEERVLLWTARGIKAIEKCPA